MHDYLTTLTWPSANIWLYHKWGVHATCICPGKLNNTWNESRLLLFSSLISFSKCIKLICSKVYCLSVGVSCALSLAKSTLFSLKDCVTLLVIQAECKECSACSRGVFMNQLQLNYLLVLWISTGIGCELDQLCMDVNILSQKLSINAHCNQI